MFRTLIIFFFFFFLNKDNRIDTHLIEEPEKSSKLVVSTEKARSEKKKYIWQYFVNLRLRANIEKYCSAPQDKKPDSPAKEKLPPLMTTVYSQFPSQRLFRNINYTSYCKKFGPLNSFETHMQGYRSPKIPELLASIF